MPTAGAEAASAVTHTTSCNAGEADQTETSPPSVSRPYFSPLNKCVWFINLYSSGKEKKKPSIWGQKVAVTLSLLNSVQLLLVSLLFFGVYSLIVLQTIGWIIVSEPIENLSSGACCTAALQVEIKEYKEEDEEKLY